MNRLENDRNRSVISVYYSEMESPIGPLTLCSTVKGLCLLRFGTFREHRGGVEQWLSRQLGLVNLLEEEAGLTEAKRQLEEYFAGRLQNFTLALDMHGTAFQLQVWEALRTLPYGSSASYKEIAKLIGNPLAVRAVGGANNRNPVPVIVPCHRVIGAGGSLVGYAGGLGIKTSLLQLEAELVRQEHPGMHLF